MRRRYAVVFVALILAVVVASNLSATGEITLEGLASAFSKMTQRQDELEARIAAIEEELNIPTPTPTETPEVTATVVASDTATATDTPKPTDTPSPTITSRPTHTPRPTMTSAPTATPTPSVTIFEFNELVEEHRASPIIPEIKFEDQFGYIKGQVAKLTERGDGYQLEFEGSGLDLVCRLPGTARVALQGLSVGDTFVVYGHVEIDRHFFADDDLLLEACSVALVIDGAMVWPTSTPTPRPTSTPTPRPTATVTRTPTLTPIPTLTRRSTLTPRPTSSPTRRPTSTRGPTNTPRPTRTPVPTRTVTVTPPPTPFLTVNSAWVNVRTGPGNNYPIIDAVPAGEKFDVDARNAAGTWLEFCCVKEQRGWIYAQLVILNVEVSSLPTKVPPQTPTSAPPTATPVPPTATPSSGGNSLGLRIEPENRCSHYDSDLYPYSQSVEPRIVNQQGGRIYGPYTGAYFASIRETDIEHIVARSEAHDSGLCAANSNTRRAFSNDLLNLTLASPSVNRHQKVDKDLAQWLPALNKCWYVNQVVLVKRKYNLSMDQAEANTARRVLAACSSTQMIFADPGSAPTPAPTNTPAPAHTPAPERDAQYYKNLCGVGQRGWVTIALARRCGFSMPVCRSTNPGLYEAMHDGDGDGCVGE